MNCLEELLASQILLCRVAAYNDWSKSSGSMYSSGSLIAVFNSLTLPEASESSFIAHLTFLGAF